MVESLIKSLFLIIFLQGFGMFGPQALASNAAKEISLMETNERIQELS